MQNAAAPDALDKRFVDEVIDVIYSLDKTKRYVILRADEGYYYYLYEELTKDDDEESVLLGINNEPYWQSSNFSSASFFDTQETAVKEIKCEPTYRRYFKSEE